MKARGKSVGRWLLLLLGVATGGLLPAADPNPADAVKVVAKAGIVEIIPAGTVPAEWMHVALDTTLHPGWRLRTKAHSRVTLQLSDGGGLSFGENSEVEILASPSKDRAGLRLSKGAFSFLHKEKTGRLDALSRGSYARTKGTEFAMQVEEVNGVERVTFHMIDGLMTVTNAFGSLDLTNGRMAVVEEGQQPVPSASFIVNNILQWAFYYPAVLDLRDLPPGPAEDQALAASRAAYLSGDLLAALASYPAGRQPASDAERVYHAALLLAVGNVAQTEALLDALPAGEQTAPLPRLAGALRTLIAAVKRQPRPTLPEPALPTEFLAASYYEQSRAVREDSLRSALALARRATTLSPEFSFAWARVAELEFGFGRAGAAHDALERSLALAPRNAQSLALRGFVAAARNRTREAGDWFDRAIAIDPALANAWLGRGLIRIREGDDRAGRADLLVAATLEPQRAALRSYLGKALANTGDFPLALHELNIAKQLDPADPTPWLYSALLNEQANRINEGIRDLERSVFLNDNRRLYRSQELLDQDRAVRQANLARLYRDAGLGEVSVREAARAVSSDYANYSSHLFLAHSYSALRDPSLLNLRYETPASAEYLLANLLSPVGAGTLSATVSQQEYSRLFERDRMGLVSATEYSSSGAWAQSGALHGAYGNTAASFEGFYRTDPGQRPNNDFEQHAISLTLKQQLSPRDTALLLVQRAEGAGGDLAQYYDPASAARAFRYEHEQQPLIAAGWHREWAPGSHTLLLGSYLADDLSFTNPAQPALLFFRPGGTLTSANGLTLHESYRGTIDLYTAELQHLWQTPRAATIAGARVQYADFHSRNWQELPSSFASVFPDPPAPAASQSLESQLRRQSLYLYQHWQPLQSLRLIGGLTYDHLNYPENHRTAPLSGAEETAHRLSPKAGLLWTPATGSVVRAAYTRSLSGASLDQSFQLEPSQVAGFVQSYRSIIPESVIGANAGARFETAALSLEQKLGHGTFLAAGGEILWSELDRTLGAFDVLPHLLDYAAPSGIDQRLRFRERALFASIDQLLADEFSLGAHYRIAQAGLTDRFPQVPGGLIQQDFSRSGDIESVLQQLTLQATWNSPSGVFAQVQAAWYRQENDGYAPARATADFWQYHAAAGYRFPRRRAELALALLNLGDQNYRLSPLTYYNELPRQRTLLVRLLLNF